MGFSPVPAGEAMSRSRFHDRPQRLKGRAARRGAFSLLEVLVATAIFLMSLVAIGSLVISAGRNAMAARDQARAIGMAQAKLAEVEAGAIPLDEEEDQVPMEEDANFAWSMRLEAPTFPGVPSVPNSLEADFKVVTITISRKGVDDSWQECCSLTQLVFAPDRRGNSADSADSAAAASSGSGSSTGSGSSAGSSQGSTPAKGSTPAQGSTPAKGSSPAQGSTPARGSTPAGGGGTTKVGGG